MKYISFVLFVLLMMSSYSNLCFSKEITVFGKEITLKSKNNLAEIIKNYKSYKDKTVLVGGVVEKVCIKKGCWMNLKDGDKNVRVTFKDYGFFVPKDLLNKVVEVEGVLVKKIETQSQTRHYLEDEGKSKKEIEKITGDRVVYHFVANGVKAVK